MDWLAHGLPIEGAAANAPRLGAVIRQDVPACGMEEQVSEVAARTRRAGWDLCVVINEKRVVMGVLHSRQWQAAGAAKDVMTVPSTYRPGTRIMEVLERPRQNWSHILVTTSDGELMGVAFRDAIEKAAA